MVKPFWISCRELTHFIAHNAILLHAKHIFFTKTLKEYSWLEQPKGSIVRKCLQIVFGGYLPGNNNNCEDYQNKMENVYGVM